MAGTVSGGSDRRARSRPLRKDETRISLRFGKGLRAGRSAERVSGRGFSRRMLLRAFDSTAGAVSREFLEIVGKIGNFTRRLTATENKHNANAMYSILTECPLFRGLTEDQIHEVIDGRGDYTLADYRDGELIARRDTAYSGLMIIVRGKVPRRDARRVGASRDDRAARGSAADCAGFPVRRLQQTRRSTWWPTATRRS